MILNFITDMTENKTILALEIKEIYFEQDIESIPVNQYPCININIGDSAPEKISSMLNLMTDFEIQLIVDKDDIEKLLIIEDGIIKYLFLTYSTEKGHLINSITTLPRDNERLVRSISFSYRTRIL